MLISSKEIISQSVALYRNNAKLFMRYMLLLFIPGALAISISAIGARSGFIGVGAFVVTVILSLLVYLVSGWISIAFLRAMVAAYEGRPQAPIGQTLQAATRLLWPSVWVAILTALFLLGGYLLLIIPGIIFTVWYSFTFYAVAIDEKKGMDAMRASKQLVSGRWWAVLWRLIAPGIVFGLLLLVADLIVQGVAGLFIPDLLPQKTAILVSAGVSLVSTFISLVLTPLSTAAITILYERLKQQPPAPQTQEV